MFVDRSVARYIRADCNSLPKGLKIINHIFFEGPMATGKFEKRDNSDNEPIKYWDKDNKINRIVYSACYYAKSLAN